VQQEPLKHTKIYLQLTEQAGKRQVKDAKIGLTHNVGGSGAYSRSSRLQENKVMSTQEPFTIEAVLQVLRAAKTDGWKMPEMR